MSGEGSRRRARIEDGRQEESPSGQIPLVPAYRALDSGLAKAAPSPEGLSQKNYKNFRRRLELFKMQCSCRRRDAMIEGSLLVISNLQDIAWNATKQLKFDEIENAIDPFLPLMKMLDELYQYEDLIEVPSRRAEFFSEFQRNKGEELQAYIVRHRTILKRMKEVAVNVPPLLSGWYLLTRAGIPRWTHVQVKSMCDGDLDYDKVAKALIRMFGGNSKPNPRDLNKSFQTSENFFEDVEDEEFYEEEYEDWGAEVFYEDDEVEESFEAEIPEDLEGATDAMDEAFVSYGDSRRRMRELALARRFYPVMAIGPEFGRGGRGKGDGRPKGKGKGKPKGKGPSSSTPMRRTPFNRRIMSALRRPTNAGGGSQSSNETKSTLSGSTSSHGPRFKRYRVQANGVKEAPEEQVTMVEETEQFNLDECYFVALNPGLAIVDSGATRTIVGESIWKTWLEKYGGEGVQPIKVHQKVRDFKFGGGEILRSQYEVEFTAVVKGQHLPIVASVVPGNTPFLLSRSTLEQWNVKQDYENETLKVMNSEWFKPDRGIRGHYLLDLMDYGSSRGEHVNLLEEELVNLEVEGLKLVEEAFDDPWRIEALLEKEPNGADEQVLLECDSEVVAEAVQKALQKNVNGRKLRFFEVYVDRGNLSSEMAERYEDVEVSVFGLPDWDFSSKKVQQEFLQLVLEVHPYFIWIAPPCTIWSTMQRLNTWTEFRRMMLEDQRQEEEDTHLQFTRDMADLSEEEDIGFGFEHPHGALSWSRKPLKSMEGYHDAVCNRCQTGLMLEDTKTGEVRSVKKPTRIRTKSSFLYEALNLPCTCEVGSHFNMEGKSAALKEMQNYEIGFVEKAIHACYEEMMEIWKRREIAKILMAEETMEENQKKRRADEITEEEKANMKTHGKQAVQIVAKIHRQLGHPGRDKMVRALKDANFPDEVIRCARSFVCEICAADGNKKADKPASLPQAPHVNELLEIDVFHLKWNDDKDKKKILARHPIKRRSLIAIFSLSILNCTDQSRTSPVANHQLLITLPPVENKIANLKTFILRTRTSQKGSSEIGICIGLDERSSG